MKTQLALAGFIGAALVVAGVLFFLAYSESDAEGETDWIVTGLSMNLTDSGQLSIGVEYTVPGDQIGSWDASATSMNGSSMLTCWKTARIGAPIPDCLRTIVPQP